MCWWKAKDQRAQQGFYENAILAEARSGGAADHNGINGARG
jgi:hypothetical protein